MPTCFVLTLRLRDLNGVRSACRNKGWEFREGQCSYRWSAFRLEGRLVSHGLCSHAVAIPACRYELGLVNSGTHWVPAWDNEPRGGLALALGTNASNLWQAYVAEMACQAARRRGHIVSTFIDDQQTLRLRVVSGIPGQVAHLAVRADATAHLWDLTPDRVAFRYLCDALGDAHLHETSLPSSPAVPGHAPAVLRPGLALCPSAPGLPGM
jgi:hypothetical protein